MDKAVFQEFVDRVRDASEIVRIVGEYVPLKRKGRNYWGACPFHQERTASFSVAPDKGFFYCFGCHAGGNVINFIMRTEALSFLEAVTFLARRANIPVPELAGRRKPGQEERRERGWKALDLAKDFYQACLLKTRFGEPALRYLEQRGIPRATVEEFSLGLAPAQWDRLYQALLGKGVTAQDLSDTGLVQERHSGSGYVDRFRSRIMIPIRDEHGHVVGFGGRTMEAVEPKYLNSPETDWFNKRGLLFALEKAKKPIRDSGIAVLVEGYMDAISAHAVGIRNVVAALGTAFSTEQARLLKRYAKEVVVAFDMDVAGRNAALRAMEILSAAGLVARVVSLPHGKDPDDYIRQFGAAAFQDRVQQAEPFMEYRVNLVFKEAEKVTGEGILPLVGKLVPLLATCDNAVEQDYYVRRVAERLAVDEGVLRREISRSRSRQAGEHRRPIAPLPLVESNDPGGTTGAEQLLLRLLSEDHAIGPYVTSQLDEADLSHDKRREIFRLLAQGTENQRLLETLSDEAVPEFTRILAMDVPTEENLRLVDDCIRKIRIARLKQRYTKHAQRAAELENLGDSGFLQELAESQRIKNEISKLYQGGTD